MGVRLPEAQFVVVSRSRPAFKLANSFVVKPPVVRRTFIHSIRAIASDAVNGAASTEPVVNID